jgi:ABC-2 type transport system permease protein
MTDYFVLLYSFREFIKQSVIRDLKVRYKRSIIGVGWSILNPLLMMSVMSLAFQVFMRVNIDHYPFFLISGLMSWTFFQASLVDSFNILVGTSGVYTKIYVPKAVFVIASATSHLVNFSFSLVAVLVIMLGFRFFPTWHFVYMIPIIGLTYLFVLGISLIASLVNIFFRDVQYLVMAGLTALFYMTPVFYSLKQVPAKYIPFLQMNPMMAFVELPRYALYYHETPPAHFWLVAVIVSVTTFLTGLFLYAAKDDKIIYYI